MIVKISKNTVNKLLSEFSGYGKTDNDFVAMFRKLYAMGLSLLDGDVDYNGDMTTKHYKYRVVTGSTDENGDWYEEKTLGWLVADKCFINGIDKPYEILAYLS